MCFPSMDHLERQIGTFRVNLFKNCYDRANEIKNVFQLYFRNASDPSAYLRGHAR